MQKIMESTEKINTMKNSLHPFKSLSIVGVGAFLWILPCISSVNAQYQPRTQRNSADVSGNSTTHTNVQVDTSGRDNVNQRYRSEIEGTGVQSSTSVQLNFSGCKDQNSTQTVSQSKTGIGANANASVSVCNPARKLRN